jgi:hypothetical protein
MTRLFHMTAHRPAKPLHSGTSRQEWCVRVTRTQVSGGYTAANLDPSDSSGAAM